MDTFTKVFQWIWYSSADPSKVSLTVRATLLGIVPVVLNAVSLACGFGLVCLGIDAEGLNGVVNGIEAIVVGVLSVVAAIGMLYGFVRKVVLTSKS